MKRQFLLLLLSCFASLTSLAQGGQWAWVNGSNTPNASAVYGTEGVPSASNTPTGLVYCATWTDLQGNFWIYGGFDSSLSASCAMWKYSPGNNEWAWMSGNTGFQEQGEPGPGVAVYGTKGVASPSNFPGARVWMTQWTDNNGNLWLFGGDGWDSTGYYVIFNDLWEYNTSTNLWTWVSGSNQSEATDIYGTYQQPSDTAMPGGRYGQCH